MSTSLNLAPELSVASTASPSLPLNGHSPALELSPRLHNRDLAPTRIEGRRWGRYSIFALWTNDVHNIANYSFAMGLFALGLGGWHSRRASARRTPNVTIASSQATARQPLGGCNLVSLNIGAPSRKFDRFDRDLQPQPGSDLA